MLLMKDGVLVPRSIVEAKMREPVFDKVIGCEMDYPFHDPIWHLNHSCFCQQTVAK